MDNELFEDLVQSVRDMGKHRRGERVKGARQVEIAPIKEVRKRNRLSQAQFAELIDVPVKTLQNWEQRRVIPTGPALALIRAIGRDPEHVIPALQSGERDNRSSLTSKSGSGSGQKRLLLAPRAGANRQTNDHLRSLRASCSPRSARLSCSESDLTDTVRSD